MTELQSMILVAFKEFQRVCAENNLHYYAIGGTCLGAIRHNGFIPWDDDLDVAMPLEDYQKLRRAWPQMLRNPYQILDYEKVQHCEINFLKLFNGNTTFIEKAVEQMPERYTGVFIDIMPIVGYPETEKERKSLLQRCTHILRLNRSRRFEFRFKSTLKGKVFSIFSRPFISRKPFNYFSLRYEDLINNYPFGETQNVFFPWRIPVHPPYKNVFPYEIFRESLSVPFEDTEICVPKDYDRYLTMDFGDYMKFPPEDKRNGGHPAAIIDFHKSYREYQEAKR